ncbi:hypothetical protein K450DRAFT_250473 [Umbelopsis ramanniana AG]|uniref:Transmembrane protein n=1 Tax=Umbelopsis ramanniana AG TaxID=1314678 RepID=A0AAD5HD15_UMBRA|nr:uncharacterized protein K450DRAFT_250473 [Umbelopsis ramanniana AG]KAI8577713.1 hypothetical protein K450DRAFT_250473 [Umbelopsis ramanniana AG]
MSTINDITENQSTKEENGMVAETIQLMKIATTTSRGRIGAHLGRNMGRMARDQPNGYLKEGKSHQNHLQLDKRRLYLPSRMSIAMIPRKMTMIRPHRIGNIDLKPVSNIGLPQLIFNACIISFLYLFDFLFRHLSTSKVIW